MRLLAAASLAFALLNLWWSEWDMAWVAMGLLSAFMLRRTIDAHDEISRRGAMIAVAAMEVRRYGELLAKAVVTMEMYDAELSRRSAGSTREPAPTTD